MKTRPQEEYKKKWTGCVEVITGEETAKFTSIQQLKDGSIKAFPDGTYSIRIKLNTLPKEAKRVIKPNVKEPKKFRIRLNDDGDEVETVTPYNGVFSGRGLGIAKRDENYVFISKTYNEGTKDENSHLEFISTYGITEGPYQGVELPGFYLHYKFEGIPEGDEDEGFTRFDTKNTSNASQLHRLQAWGEVHGNILEAPIVWDTEEIEGVSNKVIETYSKNHKSEFANILPELDARILDADREFTLVFEKGQISSIQAKENYEEVEVEESEELDEVDSAFPQDDSVEVVEEVVPVHSKSEAKRIAIQKKAKKVVEEELDEL